MAETKREKVFKILNGRCFYCGCKLDFDNFHMDHFVAKSSNGKGGKNLVPSCPECNLCKSNLDVESFRQKLSSDILNSFQGKMIQKYYKIGFQPITFYFEKEDINGFI